MISISLEVLAVYLLLGFLASSLLRKRRPEDFAESFLSSLVALPLIILIATAVLARHAKHLVHGGSGPAAAA
jgi:uncharacterized membrane protein SirB2